MTDQIEPGDYVMHPSEEGVRGLVLWVDDSHRGRDGIIAHVCWETGYEADSAVRTHELKKVNVLDLIVDGRELEYRQEGINSRCRCGAKMNEMSHGWMYCQRCRKEVEPQ